ncbi:MAG: hypothetical protein J6C18_01705 [Bacteroidaceae bacterium]|nr:hypothetical protein [Bacteroidaceae bacterium]
MIKNSNPHRGRKAALTFLVVLFTLSTVPLTAQVTERERPAEIAVTIDGKPIGTTTIDALAPYARTTATLPQAALEQGTCEVTATVDGQLTVLGKFTL